MFRVLQQAQSVEDLAAAVYAAAATRYQSDAQWSGLFRRLSGEETQHALRIKMLGTRLSNDRKALAAAELAEDVDFEELLKAGQDLLARVSGPAELSLPDFVREVARMERNFASVHAHTLLQAGAPEFKELFVQLAAQDRAHADMLAQVRQTPTT